MLIFFFFSRKPSGATDVGGGVLPESVKNRRATLVDILFRVLRMNKENKRCVWSVHRHSRGKTRQRQCTLELASIESGIAMHL